MSGVFSPFPPSGSSTLGQFWNQSSPSAVLAQDKEAGMKTAVAPIPPELAKRELRSIKPKDVKEFKTVWKYHADQGYQTSDWVSFIPGLLHPAIVLLLQALRDKQGQLVHTQDEVDEWKTWDVFKFIDNITLSVEPQTITVNEQLDSLDQTTFPETLFTPTALAETMSSYAEKLEKHGLLYEDVEKKVNKSLVAAFDNRIHRMGVAEANLTKRLRNDNGGDLPGTLKAYNELANRIIGEHLHAKRQSDALSNSGATSSSRPPYNSGYQRKTVSSIRDREDEETHQEQKRRERDRSLDRPTPRDKYDNRCSGCGNAGHHYNECFHANSTWFNKKGGDYRLSDKGKAYKARYKHTRISFRDVAPDTSLETMDRGHRDYEKKARAHSVARGNEALAATRDRNQDRDRGRGRSRSRDRNPRRDNSSSRSRSRSQSRSRENTESSENRGRDRKRSDRHRSRTPESDRDKGNKRSRGRH